MRLVGFVLGLAGLLLWAYTFCVAVSRLSRQPKLGQPWRYVLLLPVCLFGIWVSFFLALTFYIDLRNGR